MQEPLNFVVIDFPEEDDIYTKTEIDSEKQGYLEIIVIVESTMNEAVKDIFEGITVGRFEVTGLMVHCGIEEGFCHFWL